QLFLGDGSGYGTAQQLEECSEPGVIQPDNGVHPFPLDGLCTTVIPVQHPAITGDCFLNLCEKFFFSGVLPSGLPKKLIEMNTGISEFFSELFGKGGFATAGCAYDVDSFHQRRRFVTTNQSGQYCFTCKHKRVPSCGLLVQICFVALVT